MKNRDRALAKLKETLETNCLRMTQQRIEVYLAVAASGCHPCVSEVHEMVRETLPTVSLDTVYRTLWKLSELGLIAPVSSSGDRVRFDAYMRRHHHFVCARCGAVYDFDSPSLDEIRIPEEAWSLGYVWNSHMELRGICLGCCDESGGTEEGHADG
ncbi:MAG: Peroxide-responsive repressor PerR [candidate division Hyd24-12 bacterium ADurb.Bin004]|nr:MAG: Peroxide-responsive repressor PerR [candidate division Hyd24-12 bacterium ADurb.Bin004]